MSERTAVPDLKDVGRDRTLLEKTLQKYIANLEVLAKNIPKSSGAGTGNPHGYATLHNVLLTGSTGSIGSRILKALLEQPSISHVYCLDRSADSAVIQAVRRARRRAVLPTSALADGDRVTRLAGDLSSDSNFGLEPAAYAKLLSSTTLVIHNAWTVNFNLSLPSFSDSLAGVANLSAFCARCTKSPPLLFLSTIGAVMNMANASSPDIPEEIIPDLAAPVPGYGESKYVAERLLERAVESMGITVGIVRVGQVSGPVNGPGQWNKTEFLPRLFISAKALRVIPESLSGQKNDADYISWIPIDVLSKVLVELGLKLCSEESASSVHVFHAVNPQHTTWSALLPSIIETLEKLPADDPRGERRPIAVVSPKAWLQQLNDAAANLPNGPEYRLAIAAIPALKLLDFYQRLYERASRARWATAKAEEASESLRGLESIKPEWMAKWTKDWLVDDHVQDIGVLEQGKMKL